MKLNKTIGRVATTLVATAMLASLAAVPAFADETGVLTPDEGKITIKHNLVMPSNMVTPGVEFKFDITTTNVGSDEDIKLGDDYLLVRAGKESKTDAGKATITAGAEGTVSGDNKTKTIETSVELTLPVETYTDAGVYKYQIQEQTQTATGYTDKTGALDLYLIVERQAGEDQKLNTADDVFAVVNAIVYPDNDKSGTGTGKTEIYTNYYKLKDDGTADVGSIKVTKKVTGAMGSMNDTFSFHIDLPEGGDYSIILNNADEPTDFTDGNFELKNGEYVTITGLPEGSYAITETVSDGYEISSVAADTSTTDSTPEANVTKKLEDSKVVGATVKAEADKSYGVVITNNRDAVSPTGIVMNVAPYALLVVIAAAGCFVFLRKRRED